MLHAETGRNSHCERHKTTCIVGEAEPQKGGGGQHKLKEAENKSKTTYTLKKGDGRRRW
jgi:dsRNA-specific ribonuclease